jgi:hypothetical protein
MIRPWYGGRRIAFVPVSNSQVDTTLPSGFQDQVWRRAFYDPDPTTGVDRSLQAYIRTVSSGYAHMDGDVLRPVVANGVDTMGAAINALPANHTFDVAVAVLPHAFGQHRSAWAWWDATEQNGIRDWCRIALFQDPTFTMRQGVGVWAMEALHSSTHVGDLYNVSPAPGPFDVMACSCGTHPSTNTKSTMGWLHSGAVRPHAIGTSATYTLHALSLPQPPPPGRVTAVSVKSLDTAGQFVIEARLRTDVYETPSTLSSGIPSEGVVVYEVQGVTQVFLRRAGMGAGASFSDSTEGLTVRVTSRVDGGFKVSITSRATKRCTELLQQIEALREAIEHETDINLRKQLISALARAMNEFRVLNCVIRPRIDSDVDLAPIFAPPDAGAAPGGGGGTAPKPPRPRTPRKRMER